VVPLFDRSVGSHNDTMLGDVGHSCEGLNSFIHGSGYFSVWSSELCSLPVANSALALPPSGALVVADVFGSLDS